MAASAPVCDFGWSPPPFRLPATDGLTYTLADIAGPRGTLIMFICNHCPYVLAVLDRILRDARDLQTIGIGVAAICANDADTYPQDGFDRMRDMAVKHGFTFPYLHDADQSVAIAWKAACTPEFLGLNASGTLQYRGRLDVSGRTPGPPDAPRELFAAMTLIADTGQGPRDQVASIGCSIKWKTAWLA